MTSKVSYDMIDVLFKRRGVNVKAKIRTIEGILLSLVVILNAYLVYLNINVSDYNKINKRCG